MAKPKCLMRDFTNSYRIYKAHRTNVWWIMKVFWLYWYKCLLHIGTSSLRWWWGVTPNTLMLLVGTMRSSFSAQDNTVQCCYNTVNFIQDIHERHPIACPPGWGFGCLLWVQLVINILPQFLQWCVQYHVMLDHVITALDCTNQSMAEFVKTS